MKLKLYPDRPTSRLVKTISFLGGLLLTGLVIGVFTLTPPEMADAMPVVRALCVFALVTLGVSMAGFYRREER